MGLLAILAGFTLLIAFFVDSPETTFFGQVRQVFGQFPTLLVAFFMFNVATSLFEYKVSTNSKLSLFAQFLLILLVPAFLTSLYPSAADAEWITSQGQAGGWLGYVITYELLYNKTPFFGNLTPVVLGALILIFTPVAISLSVSKIIDVVVAVFSWVGSIFGKIFKRAPRAEVAEIPTKASRFGDFNEQIAAKEKEPALNPRHKDIPPAKEEKIAQSGIEVVVGEKQIGDQGLSASELQYPNWKLPPLSLLNPYRKMQLKDANLDRNAKIIEQTLLSFNIDAKVNDARVGPAVVQYAIDIPLGIKVEKVAALDKNLALALGVDSKAIRIESIPGTTYLGVEVPRSKRDTVHIRELLEAQVGSGDDYILPIPLGKDVSGNCQTSDLQKMPHLLIAGATGSGKSILTNAFIINILTTRTPDEVQMILVDPKQVELSDYNGIPHLLTPVITDMTKVVNALKWAVGEMERRYTILAHAQVRNIEGYNKKLGFAAMPYILIVVDEMADMMMTGSRVDAETAIVRLAQKARAVGIHLVLATQRPSVNVITGIIKANIPARVGMSVASSVDSRVILDTIGSESLMGRGDLLYKAPDKNKSARLQGPLVTQEEVIRIVNFIKAQEPEVQYATSILESPMQAGDGEGSDGEQSDDDLFAEAVRLVVNYQKGSSSFLQRKLKIGFNRAARLIEEMEEAGILGPAQGSKPREVLVTDAEATLVQLQPE